MTERINWKDPKLFRRYIDLCMEEVNAKNTSGGSLKKDSWEKIRNILAYEFETIKWTQKKLKNEWDYLKKKTQVWNKLVGITGNTHYDPDTNTINWTAEQWDDYIQKNPEATQFRYKPLAYADEMRSLFDGMMATGKDAWGPSKEGLPTNDFNSSTINVESEDGGNPRSSAPILENKASSSQLKPEKMREAKRAKKEKSRNSNDLDNQLMAVLKTLEESDGPSVDECNKILDEMESLEMMDPLYIAATSIFCEGKAYREQWIRLSTKTEEVQKNWIAMNGKRLGLL